MEAILHPVELSSIQEGQQVEFNAEVRPKPGFGEGSLSTGTKDLNVLDGYKFDSIRYMRWLDRALFQTDNQAAMVETKELTHDFKPKSGTGKYSLDCGVNFYLKDSETNKLWGRGLAAYHPIELTPGLRILSPIDKLAYPLNQTIKVTTTMDAEEHADQWKNIKWKLNGKDYAPDTEKPPFAIHLDHVGNWKIEAQLKTKNPNTGEEVTLYDSAEFEVKPLEVLITPTRMVLDFKTQNSAELKVSVFVNGNEIEKPGYPVPWQTTGTKIIVDSVAWKLSAVPDNAAEGDFNPQSFKTNCKFSQQLGAATALATITVRIVGAKELFDKKHKGFNDKFEEQIFDIPVGRADLWAVNIGSVSDINNSENSFPEKAIAGAYRTYELKSFSFVLNTFQKKHSYNNQTGWSEPIVLQPALPGIGKIETNTVDYIWKAKAENGVLQPIQESPTKLVIKPSMPGKYNVDLEISLPFGNASALKVAEKNTAANSVNLSSLIEVSVEPASFTLTIGEPKTLRYLVKSLESQPAFKPGQAYADNTSSSKLGNVLYLLNNSYALWIDKVQWSDNQPSDPPPPPALTKETIESDVHEFRATMPGKVEGLAQGFLNVSELFPNSVSDRIANYPKDATWFTYIQGLSIEILVNGKPVGELEYYLGQKITLSYRLKHGIKDNIKLDNPFWNISGPKVKAYDPWVIEENPKPCKADLLTDKELAAESVELFLYCLDDENYQKTISIRGQISTGHDLAWPCSAINTIKIQHPELIELFPEVPVATLSYYFTENSPYAVYYLGYEEENNAGPTFNPTVSNQTKIGYLVGALQLVMNNHWRKLKENGIEKEEVAITHPLNKKWLDLKFPYNLYKPCAPGTTDTVFKIYGDAPFVDCDDAHPKYIEEVKAEAEYTLVFMVKPAGTSVPYEESIWVPLKAFSWNWGGHAVKQPDSTWSEVDSSIYSDGFIPEKLLEVIEWEDVANKDTIEWGAKP